MAAPHNHGGTQLLWCRLPQHHHHTTILYGAFPPRTNHPLPPSPITSSSNNKQQTTNNKQQQNSTRNTTPGPKFSCAGYTTMRRLPPPGARVSVAWTAVAFGQHVVLFSSFFFVFSLMGKVWFQGIVSVSHVFSLCLFTLIFFLLFFSTENLYRQRVFWQKMLFL